MIRKIMTSFKYPLFDTGHQYRTHNIFQKLITSNLKEGSKILDLGCASGAIGKILGQRYFVSGVEYCSKYFKEARKNCYHFYQIDLNNLTHLNKLKQKDFDMLIFADVLEHLVAPELVLSTLLNKLKNKGYVLISLPNVAQLPYRIKHLFGSFDYQNYGVMDQSHLHFYTLKSAKQFIEQSHLKIISIHGAGTLYSFFPFFPKLICSQFVFLCQKKSKR